MCSALIECLRYQSKAQQLCRVISPHFIVDTDGPHWMYNNTGIQRRVTQALKEQFTKKSQFRQYIITIILMEGQVKFLSPHNISGASQ